MKIDLLKGSVIYGGVTIFSRVAAIILIPILTRLLTPDQYGELSMALTIVILVNYVATFEVAQAVTLYFTDRNKTQRDLYPSTALRFSLMMYIVVMALTLVFGETISGAFITKTGTSILIYGALLLAANGCFFFIQNQLRLEFNSRWYALLTLGYVLLTSVGAIAGALYYPQPAQGVLLGQASGAFIIDLVGIIILSKRFRAGFDVGKLREMLKFSLPLVPAGLFLVGGQQIPKFILSYYGSLEDVGIYGLAFQIAGFAGLAILGVQTAITPSILANHHQAETPKLLSRLFDIFAMVSLLFCSFLSVFAKELVLIFSTSSYLRAANFVPFLAFAIAFNGLYIFFPGKIINGKSRSQLVASAGSFLVALCTGFLLIRFDGIRGAALSALISAASFFCLWCYISQNLYRVPVDWGKLLKASVLTVAVCLIGIFVIPPGITFLSISLKSILLALFACVIGWKYLLELWARYKSKTGV